MQDDSHFSVSGRNFERVSLTETLTLTPFDDVIITFPYQNNRWQRLVLIVPTKLLYLCHYASNDLFIFSRMGYLLYFIPKPVVFAIFIRGKNYSKIALPN